MTNIRASVVLINKKEFKDYIKTLKAICENSDITFTYEKEKGKSVYQINLIKSDRFSFDTKAADTHVLTFNCHLLHDHPTITEIN